MIWDRERRFDDRRGGESYRPPERLGRSPSRGFIRHNRSPRSRSPRLVADTWVPSAGRESNRARSRSPTTFRRRSRSPSFRRDTGIRYHGRPRSPRRLSPRRNERPRSPPPTSWRPRSPYNSGRSREGSRGRTPPKRPREISPSGQGSRSSKRECPNPSISHKNARGFSPERHCSTREHMSRVPIFQSSRSPLRDARHDRHPEGSFKRRSMSPSRRVSSVHTSAPDSATTSRRSSPLVHSGRINVAILGSRSRSPVTQPMHNPRPSQTTGHSPPYQDRISSQDSRVSHQDASKHRHSTEEPTASSSVERDQSRNNDGVLHGAEPQQPRCGQPSAVQVINNAPIQPRGYGKSHGQAPPGGPSHISKSSSRSHGPNISLLSAPTRPRGGHTFRENTWGGTLPARRGPISSATRGPPSGPRSNFTPSVPTNETHSHSPYRKVSTAAVTYPRAPRHTNHLSGLSSIIPGGKIRSSGLDPAVEKRLIQLEADEERLLEQVAEKQRTKRAGIRDWERLDRESSISSLKSELAEGHLQRMAEGESIRGGALF